VPLGVTSRRGGKSSAWVFTILLVILYYSLSLVGIAMGRQNWIPTFLAVWSANILFAAAASSCCGKWPAAASRSAASPAGPRAPRKPNRSPARTNRIGRLGRRHCWPPPRPGFVPASPQKVSRCIPRILDAIRGA
jgi:hypothetical protein